ncbi:glycosyltransferase family 4 protein [Hyphobacterium sp. CCMP332]|nr:glycosyltransferase family 4 protein [Hyphobacterium sp. CCMP332]
MRLLFICNEYPPAPHGGIGIVVKDIAEYLVAQGHDVLVLGYDKSIKKDISESSNGVIVHRLLNPYLNKGIKISRFRLSAGPYLERKHLSKRLKKQIAYFNPDIIESYDWSGPLWSKPKSHLIVRMHGANSAYQYFEKKRMSRLLYFFEKRNIQMADTLISVSKHMADLTLESLRMNKDYSVIYNCVDTTFFTNQQEVRRDPNLLLFVGRIHPRKGLEELFMTMNIIFEKRPQTKLQLLGAFDPVFKNQLEGLLKSDAYLEKVEFFGKIPHSELVDHYNKASLVLVPSRAEAFGLVAIEAMACETPVCMANKASGPEIIRDGEGAWLLNYDNSEESANLIIEKLSRPELISKQGKVARAHIKDHFSSEKILKKNVQFYHQILSAKAKTKAIES